MLVAALVIYIFATNSQVIWLYLVASLVAGLAVVGAAAPWLVVRRLRPRLVGHRRAGFAPALPQDRGRVFAGDRLTLELDLGESRAPVELRDLREAGGGLVEIASHSAGDRAVTVELDAGPRGLRSLRTIQAVSSWPLGITRAQRQVRLDLDLVVHPRYLLPPEARRSGAREPAGASASRGLGEEFLGLREYRSGDSQRRIHWPTSARTGTLMVVETARDSSAASAYQLDLLEGGADAAELAVGVAASLGAGNVATGVPLVMAIPGQPQPVHRWPEILSALARARVGDPVPARRGREALRVTARAGQVVVERAGVTRVVDGGVSLEAALRALGED
jgi:uncharacterized protein (DUF58 family)